MIYTVKNVVTEGTIGGSIELEHLLKHMTHTTEDNAVDPELKQIQSIVDAIKSDKKVGERYMTFEEIIAYEKRDSYNEGVETGIQALIEVLHETGTTTSVIKTKLIEKFNISEAVADEYIKKTLKITSK